MQNIKLLDSIAAQTRQQAEINKEMVELSNSNSGILQSINEGIYPKLFEFKDQDVPAIVTNGFLDSFDKLLTCYNQLIEQYNHHLSNQIDLTIKTTTILTEAYSE